jgi:hypothetical protein
MKAVCLALPVLLCLVALRPLDARANDGRDRYQVGYPNLFVHLEGPAGKSAGFRTLSEDMPGGADGDTDYRWAQSHAIAVIEVAAFRTAVALGEGPNDMAVFDLSSENGDTPVGFGRAADGKAPKAPRGRHPGGSHDGGLNLDLGYYLTDLRGKTNAPDFAACTAHFAKAAKGTGEAKDENMCLGPADRLDVDRQAYFFYQLAELHRGQFGGRLLDEVGVDREVLKAVLERLDQWRQKSEHDVRSEPVDVLRSICTSDRWGGWQRYHHHHAHVRLQPTSPTGPMRRQILEIEQEARSHRAALMGRAAPDSAFVVDARLLSYRMQRAIEVRIPRVPGHSGEVARVRYRLDGGEWQPPDDGEDEDFRYVFDLRDGLAAGGGKALVEAELGIGAEKPVVLAAEVALPGQDPRLRIRHDPGQITGSASVKGRKVSLKISYPPVLRHILTGVRYRLYPTGGGEPAVHTVEAGWFAKRAGTPGKARRVSKEGLPLTLKVKEAPAYIEAEAILSGRYRVPVAMHLGPGSGAL